MRKYSILAIFTLICTLCFAREDFKNVVLVSSENRNIILEYYGLEKISTTLTIKDESHSVLFQETKTTPNLLTNEFLLNELSGNTFIVHLENKYKSIKTAYRFDESRDQAIPEGNAIEVFKPIFSQKGKEVTVYLLNSFQKKVTIEVIDIHGSNLVPKIITTKSAITQVFDFSSFTKKARIRVKNSQSFTKEFKF
ncbi:hypothetical protein U6A24_21470 [Aquimarina gracilis]|uniref:Uncharacterized protein n=1 Tax=Aquimarina gracilis TaxID=874422 RepID=A0ABU6A1Z0_9FLAO|nr:hypothetical protein [Aquimarina gracilis]MEB3348060.1 hypothetical protein [Aquimarina gracilis]